MLKHLRTSLQPTITELQTAIDYWSTVAVRQERMSPEEHIYYNKLVAVMKDLKEFIIEQERYDDDETIRILSRSNGGLHTETNDSMATASSGTADEERYHFSRSNS